MQKQSFLLEAKGSQPNATFHLGGSLLMETASGNLPWRYCLSIRSAGAVKYEYLIMHWLNPCVLGKDKECVCWWVWRLEKKQDLRDVHVSPGIFQILNLIKTTHTTLKHSKGKMKEMLQELMCLAYLTQEVYCSAVNNKLTIYSWVDRAFVLHMAKVYSIPSTPENLSSHY